MQPRFNGVQAAFDAEGEVSVNKRTGREGRSGENEEDKEQWFTKAIFHAVFLVAREKQNPEILRANRQTIQ